jgi:hypothetical protein
MSTGGEALAVLQIAEADRHISPIQASGAVFCEG